MSIKTKVAALALATVTIAGGLAATTQTADAKWKSGYGWGAAGVGFAAGALIGAGVANSYAAGPAYYGYGPAYSCRWEPRYNQFGYYIGKTKVCGYY